MYDQDEFNRIFKNENKTSEVEILEPRGNVERRAKKNVDSINSKALSKVRNLVRK